MLFCQPLLIAAEVPFIRISESYFEKKDTYCHSAVNIISSIQTTEAIKILIGDLDLLIKGLIIIDIWDLSLDIIEIKEA